MLGSALQRQGLVRCCRDPTNLLNTVRWFPRKDGARFAQQIRQPTQKQRRKRFLKVKKLQAAQDKHSPPGSKAGPERAASEMERQELMNPPAELPEFTEGEYGPDNAMMEDLMGNSDQSMPNPVPRYFGDKQGFYFNKVANRMGAYHKSAETGKNEVALNNVPTDHDIANALRAFRDANGTRRRPVGLVKVLNHVINDLKVPLDFLDEYSFNAILTCCQTPQEGRKVFQIMNEQKVEVKAYSYSILVDIYAKVGDYENCGKVHDEMLANGLSPTLASYTSLMTACHKVVNDGRVPHHIRAKAAKFGWEKFQECRIIGLKADTMLYGAILRIFSAMGQPEKCLNLLEEMSQFDCVPTTLCFTSALKAVARSHQISIRYEKGKSKRNRSREQIALWHGKLARQVLIMAENSGCELDQGFISALILCAGAAGDVATAKAIYTSWQIRQLDHLRTIGTDAHLARLRGEKVSEQDALTTSDGSLVENQKYVAPESRRYHEFAEREYGKDNRVLTALLSACASACDKTGLGTLWQGRENEGYFCINSLRLIAEFRKPRYVDKTIPGSRTTDPLTFKGAHHDERYREGKRFSRKFSGVTVDPNTSYDLDDMDESFTKMFLTEDGLLKPEYRKSTPEDIWKLKYGKSYEEETEEYERLQAEKAAKQLEEKDNALALEGKSQFDPVEKKFKSGVAAQDAVLSQTKTDGALYSDSTSDSESESDEDSDDHLEDLDSDAFFDGGDAELGWKTDQLPRESLESANSETSAIELTNFEKARLENKEKTRYPGGFLDFFDELKQECIREGETPPTEEEATDLYELMSDEYKEMIEKPSKFGEAEDGLAAKVEPETASISTVSGKQSDEQLSPDTTESGMEVEPATPKPPENRFEDIVADIKSQWRDEGFDLGEEEDAMLPPKRSTSLAESATPGLVPDETQVSRGPQTVTMYDSFPTEGEPSTQMETLLSDPSKTFSDLMQNSPTEMDLVEPEPERDEKLEELRRYLPSFSERRLKRVMNVFRQNLGDARMLELIPVVRETMPDYITNTWLKKMSSITSRFIMAKADDEDVVDINMLNAVLALHASAGRLDQALYFHQREFRTFGVEPNGYSDRLVLQMFLRNRRFERALDFKRKLEEQGRTIDIKGYGSLVEYWSSRKQLGSAMLFLRECIAVHDSPPSEAHLKMLRLLSRKNNLDSKLKLEKLIGKDPEEWIRWSEGKGKREYSKKGNRWHRHLRNVATRIK